MTDRYTAARGIGVYTIEFPDPTKINYVNNDFNTLNESISFQYRNVTNIQTLSTKGEARHVPANATRIANLPADQNYALVAFAPWYSAQCTIEYFTAARNQSTTKAFLTYLPGNSNAQPPVLNNPAWNLQDGGMWQQQNTFPTYALSSTSGNTVMDQLNLYSGNLSTVPNGAELSTIYDDSQYVRLWATVSTDSGGTLPSLWVFLVIVLAILIAAIASTSLCMHIIQRRRRNALRQRVLNGEIDLEALGVKRLTVPQETLDKLPIVTYTPGPAEDAEKPIHTSTAAHNLAAVDAETGSKPSPLACCLSAPAASTTNNVTFSQLTCPICIDDFEPNETQVRELPCRHIFHPDCIDTFLLRNSSLCPMCKQSVLPPGACPVTITNMMVRRERHIARMRERSAWSAASGSAAPPVPVTLTDHARRVPSAFGSLGRAVAGRRIFSAPERTQAPRADIEMGSPTPAQVVPPPPQPAPSAPAAAQPDPHDCEPPATPTHNRREWARQRALHLLGNRPVPTDVDDEARAQPRWRRALTTVFPGFR
ncbi:hypothetical protein EJ07DRAFT_130444 [Lizonia empirigonia]|nr:hypothetical protein EJ07DRAFT_130444 [Lizonia empirigonia]